MKRLFFVFAGIVFLLGLAGAAAAQEQRPGPQHSAPDRPSAPHSPPPSAPPPSTGSMGAPSSGGSSGSSGGAMAVPRYPGAARGGAADEGRVRTPKASARVPPGERGSAPADQSGRRRVPVAGEAGSQRGQGAVDRYSRPRSGRPVTGVAVPRQGGVYRGGYGYYETYPYWRSYYPYYGFGAWGVGFWYYDPWFWGPYGYGGYGGYGTYYRVRYDDTGSLRLKIAPREAQVFVDGYYAGVVDEFDGIFQRLHVEPGPHRIEVRLEGYESLSFDVRVLFDHTITLTGELKPAVR